jgi:hypothetical protein
VSLKFYTDTHIDKQVAIQLRTHKVDVVRCEDVGMASATDEEHLAYAVQENRALITKDDDFIKLHVKWQHEQKSHEGIFFCPYRDRPAIGLIVRECLYFYNVIELGAGTIEADIRNRLYYIT